MTNSDAEFSDLYCRYNGMMLGFFLTGMGAEAIAEQYPRLQRRVNEFLEEVGSLPTAPADREVMLSHQERIVTEIVMALDLFAPALLVQCAHLGMVSMHYVLRASFERENSTVSPDELELTQDLRAQAEERLEKLGLPLEALDRFLQAMEWDGDTLLLQPLHTASLDFVRELLEAVGDAGNTAFVVMPFRLEERYAGFYLPLLEQLGYRGFRAWGGLSGEDYQPLMVELIRSAEATLVDVTGANPNVLYELGLAHGMDKTVFVVGDESSDELPANLRDLAIARYDSSATTWPDADAVEEAARTLKFIVAAAAPLDSRDSA